MNAGSPPPLLPEPVAAAPLPAGPRPQPVPGGVAKPLPAGESQADAVERLRRRAHLDEASGLPNRRHFIGRLHGALAERGPSGAALLILRVTRPQALAQPERADGDSLALLAAAELLAAYPQRVAGTFVGRLNETDFGLFLPVPGMAEDTAAALVRALRASPAVAPGLEVTVGGVDGLNGEPPGDALAAADQALARAESCGPFCADVQHMVDGRDEPPVGERAWRARIDEALTDGRAAIAEFPVHDAGGRLIHLECPLRVQLVVGGEFREASRWLPMASRTRLLPRVDLAALELALIAIERDGRPRCVHVSTASLATPGFVGEVQRRLEGATRACRHLWLEVADAPALGRAQPRLREAAAAWRRHGLRLGVEHAGASMQSLARLSVVGLDHVKVEARFLRGVDTEPAVREFAAGLVGLVQGMGVQIIAEGVSTPGELAVLWALGFDGATGPAVR